MTPGGVHEQIAGEQQAPYCVAVVKSEINVLVGMKQSSKEVPDKRRLKGGGETVMGKL